ncbi:MAG: glycoside hydrolase family 127 protein, partial [Clostridia bacterium]|nr:glycoside hydrolase family 127 protein [Clostridia bacterium]
EADSAYADIIERAIYNGFLASTSLDGKRFFYTNPMEIEAARRHCNGGHGEPVGAYDWLPISQRVEVFSCSCCPPNITRFVASIGDMIYTEDDDRVYVHQYMGNTADFSGAHIEISTEYPAKGLISLKASGLKGRKLCLRIPGWCESFTLSSPYAMERGYAVIDVHSDDICLCLDLSMRPVLMEANPNVADAAGKAAVMYGPLVYCMEAPDNDERLFDCMIDANLNAFMETDDTYCAPVIKADGWQRPAPEGNWLYRPFAGKLEKKTLTFIPYFAFANRGESDMRVWVPVKY